MKKLPHGILEKISAITNLPMKHISDYLNKHRGMSKERAIFLEKTTLPLGNIFTKENWMFSPEKIKLELVNSESSSCLLNNNNRTKQSETEEAAQ